MKPTLNTIAEMKDELEALSEGTRTDGRVLWLLEAILNYLEKREKEYEITGFKLEPEEGGFGELPY